MSFVDNCLENDVSLVRKEPRLREGKDSSVEKTAPVAGSDGAVEEEEEGEDDGS